MFGISGDVELELCKKLLYQDRTVFLDKWYSSPNLFNKVNRLETNACGTVRLNRKNMPDDDEVRKAAKTLKKGEMIVRNNDNTAFCAWKGKRLVSMLTTSDVPALISTNKIDFKTGERIIKPDVVVKYNQYLGGVDRLDQRTHPYQSMKKKYEVD